MPSQPPSAARIAANRANAQKSTGPRTPEGKSRVSENAWKHGLRSQRSPLTLADDTTLPAERDEFLATLAAFTGDLRPTGPFETQLVERLAQLNLRLNRAVRMETAHLNLQATLTLNEITSAAGATSPGPNDLAMLAFLRDPNALTLLGRYESRLSRDFRATLTELRRTQKSRNQTQPDVHHDPRPARNGRVAVDNSAKQSQLKVANPIEPAVASEPRPQGSGASSPFLKKFTKPPRNRFPDRIPYAHAKARPAPDR